MICSLALLQPFSFHETLIYDIIAENSSLCGNPLRIAQAIYPTTKPPRKARGHSHQILTKVSFCDNFTISSQSDSPSSKATSGAEPIQPVPTDIKSWDSHGNCLLHWTRSGSKLFPTLSSPSRCAFVPYLLEHDTNKIVVLPSSELLESRPRSFLHDDMQIRA